jgi:uncharacterized membrane protein (GlpM family)
LSQPNPQFAKAQRKVMAGVGLVMLGCVFGGLMAILLHVLGQRTAALAVGLVALAPVVAGIVLQVSGATEIRRLSRPN